MTRDVSLTDARTHLAELVNEVAYGGGRVRLTRHGTVLAAVVTAEDLEVLLRLEAERATDVESQPSLETLES